MNHPIKKIDEKLLLLLKQGDESAFESIYWKYSAWIYNFANTLLYDRLSAEDITQTVFLKVWEKHEDINPNDSFESYLFTIARNLIYKETEKRLSCEKVFEVLNQKLRKEDTLTEQQIETKSLREYIDSLIEQLPPARKEIYKLSRVEHLSNKEIAEKLNLSEKTVETQIYRALQYLKFKLSQDSGLLILFYILFC
jgi:RNA polymerase sigma-70 factor (ECF subfamily)